MPPTRHTPPLAFRRKRLLRPSFGSAHFVGSLRCGVDDGEPDLARTLTDKLLALRSWLFLATVLALSGCVVVLLVLGEAWVASRLLPVFLWTSVASFAFCLLVALPLAAPRSTRALSAALFLVASFVFGSTLWMLGLLLTLGTLGLWWAVAGTLVAGVGVVPLAFVGTALQGAWGWFGVLSLLTLLTFAGRLAAFGIAESVDGDPFL